MQVRIDVRGPYPYVGVWERDSGKVYIDGRGPYP